LGEEIAELSAHLQAVTYLLLVRLREFDEREGWSGGFRSCAHWLSWRTGIDLGAAREKVRVARALAVLPLLSRALAQGALSYAKARAVTRVATPAHEAELLELARHATAAQVERLVRAWRRTDRLEEAASEQRQHEARAVTLYLDEDGSYALRGRLTPEAGALVEQALGVAERALATLTSHGREDERLTHSPAQRRADALALVAAEALRTIGGGNGGRERQDRADAAGVTLAAPRAGTALPALADRYQVVVHVDAEALREGAETGQSAVAGGAHLSAETSRRLACDASRSFMIDDAVGRTAGVSATRRTVPPALRRALEWRDRGCRFPGCGLQRCDAHHVRHWADGGATTLENLVLLCPRHHRAVHEEGYRVTARADGVLTFHLPDGRVLPDAPATAAAPGPAVAAAIAEVVTEPWGVPVIGRLDVAFALHTLRL
jgi:hypothetical protein